MQTKKYGAAHCDEIIRLIDSVIPPEDEVKALPPPPRFPANRRDT